MVTPSDDPDDPDPFDVSTVRAMLREAGVSADVRAVEAIDDGTDIVYRIATDGSEGEWEFVVKAQQFVTPAKFRVEPRMLEFVDARTEIPVPGVEGFVDDHDELPAPYFVMRYVQDGHGDQSGELPADGLKRLSREAGSNLAMLHDATSFDAFGTVVAARDAPENDPAIDLPSGSGLAVVDAHESWIDSLATVVDSTIDQIVNGDRFDDLVPELRDWADGEFAPLRGLDPEPVVLHTDYRPGNLRFRETGETIAVLDWGNISTGHAVYDVALTEQYLCDWAPLESDRRDRVRRSLVHGYGDDLRDGDLASDRYDLYLLATALFPIAWFDLWYGGATDAQRAAIAADRRDLIRELR